MHKIKVLLVDDHLLFLEGIKATLLKEANITVVGAVTKVTDALKIMKNVPLDLIITDISMPEINGVEFIYKIKKEYSETKILVLSMFQEQSVIKHCNGYLFKDSEQHILIKAIKTIVLEDRDFFDTINKETTPVLELKNKILTTREKQIVTLIANELNVDQIAEELFISKYTVETHKKNIFFKLKVHSNAGLIKKAIQLGFL